MRYQFYREHKYVCAALNDLERQIAKTDFCNHQETVSINGSFHSLKEMLQGHAQYENERLHALLEKKHSRIHEHAEEDHAHQEEQLLHIQGMINRILNSPDTKEKISLGYQLYLTYRKFVADNLIHLHEEETKILPELQRLYTDEELQRVETETYNVMSSDELVEMMQVLFPHMNSHDRMAFLSDIKTSQPHKFSAVAQSIAPMLSQKEQEEMAMIPPK
jgi:Hemerythrin HHE cation binding domain